MSLRDEIDARLSDIESQIENVRKRAEAETAALKKRKEIFLEARKVVTDEAESVLRKLTEIGVLW